MTRRQACTFDDVAVGEALVLGPYQVPASELLEFNRRWDPLPIHVDAQAARAKGLHDVTASGQYTLCLKQHFVNQAPWREAVIGAFEWEKVSFPNPVYPEDRISATIECIEKRPSRSKPDRGIARFRIELKNQDGATVLSFLDTVMLSRHST